MAYFDSQDPGVTPGIALWRIVAATEKASSKGDNMFALKLERVEAPHDELRAYLMLEGNGRFDGRKQLSAMLPPGFKGDVTESDLRGVRVWAETIVEDYKGTPQLKVNSKASVLRCAGFQPETERPEGCAPPETDLSIPF